MTFGRRFILKALGWLGLLLAAYVGSYFVLVEHDSGMVLIPSSSGTNQPVYQVTNHYRFGGRLAQAFYWPLAELDYALRGETSFFVVESWEATPSKP